MSELSVHETLKAMRELLADEKRWTQGTYARDEHDNDVWPLDKRACKWCLVGALTHVDICNQSNGNRRHLFCLIADPIGFNDTHTHAEVIAKLDDAIKATAP